MSVRPAAEPADFTPREGAGISFCEENSKASFLLRLEEKKLKNLIMLPRSPGGWLRSPPQLCALSGGGWGAGAGLAPWESSRARENQAPWPRDPRKNVSSLIPWFSLFPASPLSTSVRLHRKCLRFCLASPPFFVRTPQEGLPRPPPRGPHQGS